MATETHQHEYHVYVDRHTPFAGVVRLTLITAEQAVLFTESGYEVTTIKSPVPLIEWIIE